MPDEFDNEETLTLSQAERRAVLKDLIPKEKNSIPPGYGPWATVRLRKVRAGSGTGTAITPAVVASFFQRRHPTATHHGDEYLHQQNGTCRHCQTGGSATWEHLLWDNDLIES